MKSLTLELTLNAHVQEFHKIVVTLPTFVSLSLYF